MDFHYLQLELLKYIALHPYCKFANFKNEDIGSNLIAYHLKELIIQKYVVKKDDEYILDVLGKKIANQIDFRNTIPSLNTEPKLSVKSHVFFGGTVQSDLVAMTRLKEPYYGFTGAIAGSVKYHQTLTEAVLFEVQEKTGLVSDHLEHVGVAHVINCMNEEVVDAKVFHLFNMYNAKGTLFENPDGYRNQMVTPSQFLAMENLHYGQKEILQEVLAGKKDIFLELRQEIPQF